MERVTHIRDQFTKGNTDDSQERLVCFACNKHIHNNIYLPQTDSNNQNVKRLLQS